MRLTHSCEYEDKRKNKEPLIKIRNKLFELENIEEELGIDLITLFKALKNGIWFRPNKNKPHKREVLLGIKNNKWVLVYRTYTFIEIKDYGKTWALTEGELL